MLDNFYYWILQITTLQLTLTFTTCLLVISFLESYEYNGDIYDSLENKVSTSSSSSSIRYWLRIANIDSLYTCSRIAELYLINENFQDYSCDPRATYTNIDSFRRVETVLFTYFTSNPLFHKINKSIFKVFITFFLHSSSLHLIKISHLRLINVWTRKLTFIQLCRKLWAIRRQSFNVISRSGSIDH